MDLEARRLTQIVITATAVLSIAACEQDPVSPEVPSGDARSAVSDPQQLRLQAEPAAVRTASEGQVFIGAGDIATCDKTTDDETADLVESLLVQYPDALVFTAGDNVYDSGTEQEYTDCYEPTWGRFKDRTWATLGNHDYALGDADPSFDYFGDRVGPRGLGYYSVEIGSWHVVMLNSNHRHVPLEPGSAQDLWLRQDLAAHTTSCVLAVVHHARYASSDTDGDFGSTDVRPLWDALYEYGADVVVAGHAHHYERFAPQDADGNLDPESGIREFVVGTGGKSVSLKDFQAPNSEVLADERAYGVIKLTLLEDAYEWEFVPIPGDSFTDSGSSACRRNHPPTVTIEEPSDGQLLVAGAEIPFAGSATDPEDGSLTADVTWTSDLDGNIGSGGSFASTLSAGTHTITASVTDGRGEQASDAVTVSVMAATDVAQVMTPSGTDGYLAFGGRRGDRHLRVTVTVVDGTGAPVTRARVTAAIQGPTPGGGTGTTNAHGRVAFKITNANPGTYITEVTDVTADGLTWDRETPPNSFQNSADPAGSEGVGSNPGGRGSPGRGAPPDDPGRAGGHEEAGVDPPGRGG